LPGNSCGATRRLPVKNACPADIRDGRIDPLAQVPSSAVRLRCWHARPPAATAPHVCSGPEPPRSVEVRGILKGPDAARMKPSVGGYLPLADTDRSPKPSYQMDFRFVSGPRGTTACAAPRRDWDLRGQRAYHGKARAPSQPLAAPWRG
jgi:hypothetical protein